MELSKRRAEAAVQFLVGLGIESSRLKTRAFGEEQPVYTRSDDPRNRCVVVERQP
jgi:outer membrane protein OmpA-like peptidoglycan-associated protein